MEPTERLPSHQLMAHPFFKSAREELVLEKELEERKLRREMERRAREEEKELQRINFMTNSPSSSPQSKKGNSNHRSTNNNNNHNGTNTPPTGSQQQQMNEFGVPHLTLQEIASMSTEPISGPSSFSPFTPPHASSQFTFYSSSQYPSTLGPTPSSPSTTNSSRGDSYNSMSSTGLFGGARKGGNINPQKRLSGTYTISKKRSSSRRTNQKEVEDKEDGEYDEESQPSPPPVQFLTPTPTISKTMSSDQHNFSESKLEERRKRRRSKRVRPEDKPHFSTDFREERWEGRGVQDEDVPDYGEENSDWRESPQPSSLHALQAILADEEDVNSSSSNGYERQSSNDSLGSSVLQNPIPLISPKRNNPSNHQKKRKQQQEQQGYSGVQGYTSPSFTSSPDSKSLQRKESISPKSSSGKKRKKLKSHSGKRKRKSLTASSRSSSKPTTTSTSDSSQPRIKEKKYASTYQTKRDGKKGEDLGHGSSSRRKNNSNGRRVVYQSVK